MTQFDKNLRDLIKGLAKVMDSQRHGIGIAACQIGMEQKVALVDVSSRVKGAKRHILINPEILELNDLKSSREGCMSLPDYVGNVIRYDKVRIRYQDERGHLKTYESQGIEAICIQHEMDHLNGMLFFDRISYLKRDLIPRSRFGSR